MNENHIEKYRELKSDQTMRESDVRLFRVLIGAVVAVIVSLLLQTPMDAWVIFGLVILTVPLVWIERRMYAETRIAAMEAELVLDKSRN